MTAFWRDVLATLCVWGLLELASRVIARPLWLPSRAAGRLLAFVPLGLIAWAWAPSGGAPAAARLPIEAQGTLGLMGMAAWAGGAVGWLLWWRERVQALRPTESVQAPPLSRPLTALTALPLLLWPYTLLPPWAIDETTYHLALPWRALVTGLRVAPLGQGNGGFYALADSFAAWGLSMGSLAAARSTQLLVATLGAQAALASVPLAWRVRVGIGFVLFWMSPVWLWQAPTAYVDGIVATFAGVAALLAARVALTEENEEPAQQTTRQSHLAALCVGAAIATKANALSLLVCLFVTLRCARNEMARRQSYGAIALALTAPLCFATYDVVVYHTPLWPFSAPWWPTPLALEPAQQDVLAAFFAQHQPAPSAWDDIWWTKCLHFVWALGFEATFASPRFDGVLGAVWPGALVGTGWAALRRLPSLSRAHPHARRQSECGLLVGAWGWVVFAAWCAGSWQARFLLPALLLWALSLCLVVPWPTQRIVRGVSFACFLLLQATFWPSLASHWPPLSQAMWQDATERAALRRAWSPTSALCEYAQAQQTRGLALVWTERELLWCPQAMLADSYDQAAHLDTWLSADDNGATALRHLDALHIDHLLINEAAWSAHVTLGTDQEQQRWHRIARNWKILEEQAFFCEGRQGSVALWARQHAP